MAGCGAPEEFVDAKCVGGLGRRPLEFAEVVTRLLALGSDVVGVGERQVELVLVGGGDHYIEQAASRFVISSALASGANASAFCATASRHANNPVVHESEWC